MLLTEEWKIALNAEGQTTMLFHRGDDPLEQANLAGMPQTREAEVALRLRLLERLMQSHVRLDL